jgi:1-acyl-sn-glycerol-3-phosphate acyltransferase
VKVNVKLPKEIKDDHYLVVCNHLSYLDIFVLSSFMPSCFITSIEMKQTPGLGHVCTLGGCLFVERRSRENIVNEVKNLEKAIEGGLNVAFYPEAKSTNGEAVLPFKRSLFQAAVNIKAKTAVFVINYKTLDGENLTLRNRDSVFWYDEMSFAPHFIQLCKRKSIEVELDFIKEISFEDCQGDSKNLRDMAYELVSTKYIPIK